jgi:hydrogenase maturation protease
MASADLVIGIGNPLRGDDGIGALVAGQARSLAAGAHRGNLRVQVVQQLTPERVLDLQRADRVLFVDACCQAAAPCLQPLAVAQPGELALGLSHRLEPAQLLALTDLLSGRAPAATLLRLPVHVLDHGQGLSPMARRQLPQARRLLLQWMNGHA